jgi:lipopolysaccharide export system protein LptA
MKRRKPKAAGAEQAFAAGVLLGAALLAASGAGLERLVVKNFSVCPAHYPPPHQTQMKSLLEGAQGQSISSTQYLVTEAKLQTFRESGEPELVVQTPECVYNSALRTISSPGALRVLTGDGKFSISGEGFLWQQTNANLAISNGASLTISNHVHSVMHPDVLAGGSPERQAQRPGGGLEVFSDRFDYATALGQGSYQRNVRVTGTNLNLTAARLTIDLPMHERELQRVTAEGAVVADYEGTHATGQKATYTTRTSLLDVFGHPAWESGERRGSGDHLSIDATNKVFVTTGNAFLRMPAQGLSVMSLLPASTNAAAAPAAATPKSFVEIDCRQYELRTNRAEFREQVRMREVSGTDLKGQLTCGNLVATYVGTNQLERMAADGGVIIEREDQRLSGARAIYDATNGVLDLIDQPQWRVGLREGDGDSIRIDTRREEMLVTGRASMRLPAAQLGAITRLAGGPIGRTNAPTPPSEPAKLFSDSYRVGRDTAQFAGNVRIEHPRIRWACRDLTVTLPPAGGRVSRIEADRAVEFDLLDAKGEKIHGTGDRAVYTYGVTGAITNEIIELTGNPVLATTNGTFQGDILLLNCLSHKVISPGRYGIHGVAPSLGTNRVAGLRGKPKSKPKK